MCGCLSLVNLEVETQWPLTSGKDISRSINLGGGQITSYYIRQIASILVCADITSYHIISYHIISYHIISYHIIQTHNIPQLLAKMIHEWTSLISPPLLPFAPQLDLCPLCPRPFLPGLPPEFGRRRGESTTPSDKMEVGNNCWDIAKPPNYFSCFEDITKDYLNLNRTCAKKHKTRHLPNNISFL